jgi:hypothetical protein
MVTCIPEIQSLNLLRNEILIDSHFHIFGLQAGWPGFDSWQGKRVFSSPQHPDWLWGPPSLVANGYQGPIPWT